MTESADEPKAGKQAAASVDPLPSVDQVTAYLERNPRFLIENPELLQHLVPPDRHEGGEVVDMQRFMVDRLQAQLDTLSSDQSELIATTRSNMSSQAQVHRAVLALLEATDFEHLVHIATHDFAQILEADVVTLCLEAEDQLDELTGKGVYVLGPGAVDALIGEGREILLRDGTNESDTIFGPAAALVRSDALVRLKLADPTPAGVLALGSREPRRFHPGQGTELLSFLAEALQRCLVHWAPRPMT